MNPKRIVAGQDTDSCRSEDTVDRDMGTDLDRAEVRRQVVADTSLGVAAESSVVEAEHRAGPGVEYTAAEPESGHTAQGGGHMRSAAEACPALLPVQERTQVADYTSH